MPNTCRRCTEPAAVQLPRGGRLCSGCAADRIAHLDAEWDVLAAQLDAMESERDEARAEVERLRKSEACWTGTAEGLIRDLKAAGFGGFMQPNTLAGMTRAAIAEVEQLRGEVEGWRHALDTCPWDPEPGE
jgi:hypothetical protein